MDRWMDGYIDRETVTVRDRAIQKETTDMQLAERQRLFTHV